MAGYLAISSTGALTPTFTRQLIATTSQITGPDRAESLSFRLENEQTLSARARIRPIFGWGGWGRARIYNDEGQDISVTDSLWIIAFGNHGLVGLVSFITALILPILMLARRIPVSNWNHPAAAPVAALSVTLIMYGLDCLANAMINSVFAAGGLSGLAVQKINMKRPRRPDSKKIAT